MMRYIYLVAIVWCGSMLHAQQEVMLTQFMFNKLSINPAYAGQNDYTELTLTYRDQWNGFPGAPTSQLLSANLPTIGKSIGISERATLAMMYSYRLQLEKSTLSMGIRVAGKRYGLDFTDDRLVATQGLSNDPSIPDGAVSRFLMNVGFGLYYEAESYYLSLSTPGLVRADIDFDENSTFSEEARHMYLMGGATFPLSERVEFTPQLLVKYAENAPFDIDMNFGFTLDERYTGALAYRFGGASGDVGESIDVLLGFQLSDRFMLGFSLDFTTSKISEYDNGSLELVMRYSFRDGMGSSARMINPRYF